MFDTVLFSLNNWGFHNLKVKGINKLLECEICPWYYLTFHAPNLFSSLQCCHQVGIVINYILRGIRCRNLSHMLRVAQQVSCRANTVTCVDLERKPSLRPTCTAFQLCSSFLPLNSIRKKIHRYSWQRIHLIKPTCHWFASNI